MWSLLFGDVALQQLLPQTYIQTDTHGEAESMSYARLAPPRAPLPLDEPGRVDSKLAAKCWCHNTLYLFISGDDTPVVDEVDTSLNTMRARPTTAVGGMVRHVV